MHQKTQMLGPWKGVVRASSYAPQIQIARHGRASFWLFLFS